MDGWYKPHAFFHFHDLVPPTPVCWAGVCRAGTDTGQEGAEVAWPAPWCAGRCWGWCWATAGGSSLGQVAPFRAESLFQDRCTTIAFPVRNKASFMVFVYLWCFWFILGIFNPVTAVVGGSRTTPCSTGSLQPVVNAQGSDLTTQLVSFFTVLTALPVLRTIESQKSRQFWSACVCVWFLFSLVCKKHVTQSKFIHCIYLHWWKPWKILK